MIIVNKIIPVILTKNEQNNIFQCLEKLKTFKEVIIFDSHSTDNTLIIAKKFKNVKIIHVNRNINYVNKINFIINKLKNKWILLLDADYVLNDDLIKSVRLCKLRKKYYYKIQIFHKVLNKVIKEKIYPSKILLFNTSKVYFKKKGHKEKINFSGKIETLKGFIIHDDKKNFSSWIRNQYNYAILDSEFLIRSSFFKLRFQDKLRYFVLIINFASLIYYIFFLNILKYKFSGLLFLLQRQIYEFLVSIIIFYKIFSPFLFIFCKLIYQLKKNKLLKIKQNC